MKICTKCNILKDFIEFSKSKSIKDGYKSACKSCLRTENRIYYQKNAEKESLRKKKQYKRDKDKIIAKQLDYYEKNKEKRSEWVKKKRQESPDVFRRYGKTYRKNHKEDINFYFRNRKRQDPLFKLISLLRTRTYDAIHYKKFNRNNSFKQYIGCSLEELKLHLEKQFQEGMNWSNHGKNGWHIDHIIPLSSAKTQNELYRLFHYKNLQPLWAIDNLKKSNKIK